METSMDDIRRDLGWFDAEEWYLAITNFRALEAESCSNLVHTIDDCIKQLNLFAGSVRMYINYIFLFFCEQDKPHFSRETNCASIEFLRDSMHSITICLRSIQYGFCGSPEQSHFFFSSQRLVELAYYLDKIQQGIATLNGQFKRIWKLASASPSSM